MRVYVWYQGVGIELAAGETVIGREPGCALRFEDPAIAPRQARLVRDGSQLSLEPLAETRVNGRAVRDRTPLGDGDEIGLGSRALVVRVAADPPTPPVDIERRRDERRPIELHTIYVSHSLEIEALTRDLSVSGVFVCTEVLDEIGTECQLTFLIGGGPPLRVAGVVRRVVHTEAAGATIGMAVEFRGLTVIQRALLERTISKLG